MGAGVRVDRVGRASDGLFFLSLASNVRCCLRSFLARGMTGDGGGTIRAFNSPLIVEITTKKPSPLRSSQVPTVQR